MVYKATYCVIFAPLDGVVRCWTLTVKPQMGFLCGSIPYVDTTDTFWSQLDTWDSKEDKIRAYLK